MRKPLPGRAIPCESERMTEITGTGALARVKELVEDIDFTMLTVGRRASVVHDKQKMAELYSPSLDIWFEEGLDTPGIALLKVTPKVTEFWEPAKGKIAMAAGMLKSLVTKDTPDEDIMNHGKIEC